MPRIDLPPYPQGWFCVGVASELAPGDVVPVRYFGRELVLLRSEGGEARLLDAHCPHLGAHFGHGGRVEGEELVCPFHGWRFGSDGACTAMPYGRRIPKAAKTRSWPLREKDGVLLAWHCERGDAPRWEMPDHALDGGRWTPTLSMRREIRGHPQEVLENTADFGHLRFVHGTHLVSPTKAPITEGAIFHVDFESDPEALVPELRLAPDAPLLEGSNFCHGPGLAGASIVPKGSGLRALQRLYATPIDDERLALHGVVNVGVLEDAAATEALAGELTKAVFEQWDRDIPIWEHKVYRAKPALNDAESALAIFRRWFEQFYETAASRPAHRPPVRGGDPGG